MSFFDDHLPVVLDKWKSWFSTFRPFHGIEIKCFRSCCARSRRYLVDHPPDWNLKWSWMTDRPFSVGSEYKLSYIKTSNTILPRARTYEGQVQSLASKLSNVLFARLTVLLNHRFVRTVFVIELWNCSGEMKFMILRLFLQNDQKVWRGCLLSGWTEVCSTIPWRKKYEIWNEIRWPTVRSPSKMGDKLKRSIRKHSLEPYACARISVTDLHADMYTSTHISGADGHMHVDPNTKKQHTQTHTHTHTPRTPLRIRTKTHAYAYVHARTYACIPCTWWHHICTSYLHTYTRAHIHSRADAYTHARACSRTRPRMHKDICTHHQREDPKSWKPFLSHTIRD